LGLITFLWAEAEDTSETLKYFGEMIEASSSEDEHEDFQLIIAVLKAWGLLVTTVETDFVVDDLIPRYLDILLTLSCSIISTIISLIGSHEPELKVVAAEALALLIESVKAVEGEVGYY
jgi:hypothetical protein